MKSGYNLQKMEVRLAWVKQLPKTKGICLNLGCGPKTIPGFINMDKYEDSPENLIVRADMEAPPLYDECVDVVYSSHALEHLPYRKARKALRNWFKILKPQGELYLAVPDLEEIMRAMLNPDISLHEKWNWYVYTLFGYQADPDTYSLDDYRLDLPNDPGQYHFCGFSKEILKVFLEDVGFTIREMYSYDGYRTPSIWVEAIKQ